MLKVAQVFELADAMRAPYRALVLLATFGCLRWGEVAALRRQNLDLDADTVRVRQAVTEQRGVGLVLGPPKSQAGRRTVSLPPAIVSAVREHLTEHVADDPETFVFTGPTGAQNWRGNFNELVGWPEAVAAAGVPGLHFHDLRHTGNALAAQTARALVI